jgi:hypothetical protein
MTTTPGSSRQHGVALLRRGQERAAVAALAASHAYPPAALGAPPVPGPTGTGSPVPTQQKEGPR